MTKIGYQAWEHMAPEFTVRSYKNAYFGQFNPLGGEKYWPDSPFLMIANKNYLRKVDVNKPPVYKMKWMFLQVHSLASAQRANK